MKSNRYDIIHDGIWRLIYWYGEYIATHECKGIAYSWEKANEPHYRGTNKFEERCMGCNRKPPATMQGFVTLLKWEN